MTKCANCNQPDRLDEDGCCPTCRRMRNQSMARKLRRGEAVDVATCPRDPDGNYILQSFEEGKDYCDSRTEEWIWSIGRRLEDNALLASTGTTFYQNDRYVCLWLR